jgi:hypothetical protein
MATRYYPTTDAATSTEDIRVSRRDVDHEWRDSFSSYPNAVTSGGTDTSYIRRVVEVQAFMPTLPGMATATYAVVSLGLAAPTGESQVMLSAAEARQVALALLRGADNADRLIEGRQS